MLIRREKKMPSKIRHGFLISLVIVGLLVISFHTSYAQTATYEYDELNRLKKITYEDGKVIQYTYDGAGNRTATYESTTPPITTANPQGGTYNSTQSVTLTCTDVSGFGCDDQETWGRFSNTVL
jgi:YD repeat-containing protein